MKSYKVITGLTTSPSEMKKNLHNLKPAGYDMGIDQLLVVASKKLGPILKKLMESSTVEHFLTLEDCDEIKEISKLVCAVVNALESTGLTFNIKFSINVNMDKHRNSLKNPPGYVFVNTTLLLEIIELFNSLENLKNDLEILYKSICIHSFAQTESGLLSLTNSVTTDSNKIIFKLNKPLTNNNYSSLALLSNDYIIMPSQSSIPLSESKSQGLSSRNDEDKQQFQTRRARSASSLENEEGYEVKDVYGAKNVIVKCIYDLQDVSSYLGTERKDVATICSPAEMEYGGPSTSGEPYKSASINDDPLSLDEMEPQNYESKQENYGNEQQNYESDQENYENEQQNHETKRRNNEIEQQNFESDGEKCCCPDCIGSSSRTADFKGDDQVVICIKGCNENEGDIQIVIRQCPDCNKAKSSSSEPADPRTLSRTTQLSEPPIKETKEAFSRTQPEEYISRTQPRESYSRTQPKESYSRTQPKESYSRTRADEIESTILHNKDSLGSLVCSIEGEEDRPLVESTVECSKIELFETTNLCLQTDTGQEFVISLTVSPKGAVARKISLADIFSDEGSKKSIPSIKRPTYFADDRYIPLVRTKVCSSLDFDVRTVESRLKNKGQIDNKNNKIVVRLQDFGNENLLRACRPAKCCRKAILNEKIKKCLPYSASIRSLPLDEGDMDIINESIEMSLQKVKNSTNLRKSAGYNNPNMYFNSVYSVMYFFVQDNQSLVKQKLNYYIHLVDDVGCKNLNNDVYYFGVQHSLLQHGETKIAKQTASNKSLHKKVSSTISNPLKWMKRKYNKYQENPVLLSPQQLILQNDSFITRNSINIPESRKKNTQPISTKVYPSRIPIPVCQNQNKPTSNSSSDKIGNDVTDEMEINYIYNASLTSIPPQPQDSIQKSSQEYKHETDSLGKKIAELTEPTNKGHSIFNYYDKIQNSSKSSMTSNFSKAKRKKKEYYLPRFGSDTSLNTLRRMYKLKLNISKNKPNNSILSTKKGTEDNSLFSLVNGDSSKLILNYFTKVLYELIMKQIVKDKLLHEDKRQISRKHMSVAVGTEKASLQEIYRNQHKRKIKNINNISVYDLKAKQPQVCLTQGSSVKPINSIYNVGMQTSTYIGQSKKCQTSNTLLENFFEMEKKSFKKELIFKQQYNYNKQNSCDEIENFTLAFASNQSFSEKFSRDFMTSESELFDDGENYTEETLEDSLNKLKETLENYEIIKSKIDETTINPIEYFVYHLCACESILNKKPTVMQRILSKSKGLFSAVEKSFKSRNAICPTCGCKVSNCQGGTSNAQPSLSCACPEELYKPKTFQHCCKKQTKTKTSTFTSQIKKSICDLFGSHKKLEPCKCTRSQHGDAVFISGNDMASGRNNKKHVSVGTTQKCGCVKCENFSDEDGTCCCSHCLGCLDKCFETTPENRSIAIEADVSVKPPENSKEAKEINTKQSLVYTSDTLEPIKDDLVISDDKIASDEADIEIVNKDDEDLENRNNTQAYFFMAPASQFLRSGNENPFQQYLLNFPNFNMFQVENPDNSFQR